MTNKFIIKIAFLGPQGSYSHTAAIKYIHQKFYKFYKIQEYSCNSFADVFKLVENHQVKYGILPLENSNSGLIHTVCDLLLDTQLTLAGNITIPIKHCILVNHHISTINQIQMIYSHPQPAQQCSTFLKCFSSWKIILCESSAVAIQTVSTLNQSNIAALGSIQGGIFYGLRPILSQNLSNQPTNTTRFIILKHSNTKIETIDNYITKKIMLIILTDLSLDQIYIILKILRFYNITITYLKSGISLFNKLKKVIILEIITPINEKHTQQALIQLRKNSYFLKILGYYVYENI